MILVAFVLYSGVTYEWEKGRQFLLDLLFQPVAEKVWRTPWEVETPLPHAGEGRRASGEPG